MSPPRFVLVSAMVPIVLLVLLSMTFAMSLITDNADTKQLKVGEPFVSNGSTAREVWFQVSLEANETVIPVSTSDNPQTLVFGPRTPVSPVGAGKHRQVMAVADPSNANNLLVAGARINPKRSATYESFVYYSHDGGKTWRESLVDDSTIWTSESSIAYGVDGTAWFAVSASDLTNSELSHRNGITRLYRSNDGGKSWDVARILPFVDWISLSIDRTRGARRGSIYLWGNLAANGFGEWLAGSPVLFVQPNGLPRNQTFSTFSKRKDDSYPIASTVLSDDSTISIVATLTGKQEQPVRIEVYSSAHSGAKAKPLAVIGKTGVFPSFAEDSVSGRLFVSWINKKDFSNVGEPVEALVVASSSDDGVSWKQNEVRLPADEKLDAMGLAPAIAVGRGGVIGFLWYGLRPGSAYFGISLDDGATIAKIVRLNSDLNSVESDEYRVHEWALGIDVSRHARNVSLRLNGGLHAAPFGSHYRPHHHSLAADRNGVFHSVWTEVHEGPLEIFTRTIELTDDSGNITRKKQFELGELVTKDFAVRVSNVRFDHSESLYVFDVALENISQNSYRGPLLLIVANVADDKFGAGKEMSVTNADNREIGEGAIWVLGSEQSKFEPGSLSPNRLVSIKIDPSISKRDGSFASFPVNVFTSN